MRGVLSRWLTRSPVLEASWQERVEMQPGKGDGVCVWGRVRSVWERASWQKSPLTWPWGDPETLLLWWRGHSWQVVTLDRSAASGRERTSAPASGELHRQWLCIGSWSDNPQSAHSADQHGAWFPSNQGLTTRDLPSCSGRCESALGWSNPWSLYWLLQRCTRANSGLFSSHLPFPEPTRPAIYHLFGVCCFSPGLLRDFICY